MERIRDGLFNAAAALGLTTICVTFLIEPLVDPRHDAVYHWSGRLSALFGPAAVYTAAILGAALLLIFSARKPGRWRVIVWAGIIFLIPWIVLRTVAITWPGRLPAMGLPRVQWGLCLWILAVALWRPSWGKRYEQVIYIASTVLAFIAISGVLFLSQFLWFWWKARGLNQPGDPPQKILASAAQRPAHRVIWIVLDELSYQQVYEHRYPGLKMPAFDGLAASSTVFTRVKPAGIQTDRVLPALMTGFDVDDIRSTADGQLLLHQSGKRGWVRFDQHNSVFEDARTAGYETGVAGWFNPYCRILPGVLDHCFWEYGEIMQNGLTPDATLHSNIVQSAYTLIGVGPVGERLWRMLGVRPNEDQVAELRIADYKNISAASDRLLGDRSATFVLLHLPFPHPPGFFNRRTGQLSSYGTYIDNLALADGYLAHVEQVLKQEGEWDSSTVILMGDHGWRTQLIWEKDHTWTPEEQRASLGGTFDDRPAYIVKLAGQTSGQRIDAPFEAIHTRALLDHLLAGEIRTMDDLKAWVAQEKAAGSQPTRKDAAGA